MKKTYLNNLITRKISKLMIEVIRISFRFSYPILDYLGYKTLNVLTTHNLATLFFFFFLILL